MHCTFARLDHSDACVMMFLGIHTARFFSHLQVPDFSLFGVYDGHGGDTVAHYAAKHFMRFLLDTKQLTATMPESEVQQRAKVAFEQALMAIDKEMASLPEIESGHDQSGSTSVMTLIGPKHIVCANTGDSRAVLARAGQAVALSHDHKPFNAGEKERIENAGSHVQFNRVNGDLAVSRALGDFVYKRCDSMSAELQAVTAFPEIICETRCPADEFIVLACDGIWDVMSSQEVVDKVHDMLANGRPPPPPSEEGGGEESATAEPRPPVSTRQWDLGAVSECLIDHCLRLGSRDNMSVIVLILNPKFMPKPEPAATGGSAAASAAGGAAAREGGGASAGAAASSTAGGKLPV